MEQHPGEGSYFSGARFCLVDAAYEPVFRYFDAFDAIGEFGFLLNTPKLSISRNALRERPSVVEAVAEDYPQRLLQFLRARNSHLSGLMVRASAA